MIYAVNKRTKEHRIADIPQGMNGWVLDGCDDIWYVVQADADGWIPHDGKECPLPGDATCDAETEMMMYQGVLAKTLQWVTVNRYRPILSETTEPEVPQYVEIAGIEFWRYDWWTKGKRYEVITKEGVKGVKADDGDFYPLDGARLAHGGHFVPCSDEHGASEWGGEGLPPVGAMCEFNIASEAPEEWIRAVVVGHYAGRAVFCMPDYKPALSKGGFPRFFSNSEPGEFRPIRSEEDRAVEAIAWILADEFDATGADCEDAARALYRAGYRKTVTADGENP